MGWTITVTVLINLSNLIHKYMYNNLLCYIFLLIDTIISGHIRKLS